MRDRKEAEARRQAAQQQSTVSASSLSSSSAGARMIIGGDGNLIPVTEAQAAQTPAKQPAALSKPSSRPEGG